MSLLLALTASGGGTSYADNLSAGAYVISGQALTDAVSKVDNLSAGAYSIAGNSLTDTVARADNLSAGSYSIVGNDLTDSYVPAGGASYADNLSAGAYVIVGSSITDSVPSVQATTYAYGRRGYIIKNRRYWLTEQELALLVAQMLEEIKRKDIKVDAPEKPKNISRRSWAELKKTLQVIEAQLSYEAEPIIRKIEKSVINEDDDEEVLMMLY